MGDLTPKPISISNYSNPEEVGYTRAISTEDWILFEHIDGTVILYRRDPSTEPDGGVVGDPVVLK